MELAFDEVGLRFDGAAYGFFSGSFSLEYDEDYEAAFVESIVLEDHTDQLMILSSQSTGDKAALFRMLAAELERRFHDDVAAYERERRWASKPPRLSLVGYAQ